MKILIRGGRVWRNGAFHPDTDVLVEGSRIAAMGQGLAAEGARVIDATDHLVLPGFVNAHTHAAMTLLRSAGDDMPLHQWLTERIFPLEARLTGEDVYWGTLLAIAEMLKGGVTTFADMYFFMDQVARAVEEAGVRAVLARGMVEASGWEKAVAETRALVEEWHGAGEGRIRVMVGPHAIYTVPTRLAETARLAEQWGLPIHIHVSETRVEVEDCLKQHGMTPVALLEREGVLQQPVLAAHCVHVTPEDIEIMARRGVAVAHNPTSNMKLGSGRAPVQAMLDAGITVAVGTDGTASNNNLDLLEEVRLAAFLAKLHETPSHLPAPACIDMLTIAGARALRLEEVGALEPGWQADIVLMRATGITWTPPHDYAAHLIYAANARDVRTVMVAGKILLEDGQLVALDEERIIAECTRRGLALVNPPADAR